MPNIDPVAKAWQSDLAARVGRAVQRLRKQRGWTAVQLSEKCSEYGYPINRVAISKIESNSRAGKLDLAELIVLAAALNTSPVTLVYPAPYDEEVPFVPGDMQSKITLAQWFSAIPDEPFEEIPQWRESTRELNNWRRLEDLESTLIFGNNDSKDLRMSIAKEIKNLREQLGVDHDA